MSRVEKRMVKQYKQRGRLQKALLFLSVVIITAGIAMRLGGNTGMQVSSVAAPTATPIASAYEESVETREITLAEVSWYTIQTGVYTDKQAAEARAQDYAERGAPGFVTRDGEKWRVLIAAFGHKEDATAVREKLSDKQQVETYLYAWLCPELKLRMTGKAGQLDVAEAGLTQMLQIAERLRNAAVEMDAGAMTCDDALAMIDDMKSQVQVWMDTMIKRFDRPYPQLVEQERKLAENWQEQQVQLEEVARSGASALSAALKLTAMFIYEQVVVMRNSMISS